MRGEEGYGKGRYHQQIVVEVAAWVEVATSSSVGRGLLASQMQS